jgi:hypothetical protein
MRVTVTHTLNAHFVEVADPSTAQFEHEGVAVTVTTATKPDGAFGTITCTGAVDVDDDLELPDPDGWMDSSAGVFILPNQQDQRYAMAVATAFRKADDALSQVGAVLRWRFALSGYDAVFKDTAVEAQLANGRALDLHLSPRAAMGDDRASIEQGGLDAAVELVTSHREPVGHELWREAWNLRHSNPRSSLVIGVAAAEVGLKQLIALLVPEAKSLVENIPSPPLDAMMRKVLPDLPIRADVEPTRRAPRHLRTAIMSAVEDRNRVVHLGAMPRGDLRGTLLAIRELLYVLDVYAGQPWAEALLADATRTALKLIEDIRRDRAEPANLFGDPQLVASGRCG